MEALIELLLRAMRGASHLGMITWRWFRRYLRSAPTTAMNDEVTTHTLEPTKNAFSAHHALFGMCAKIYLRLLKMAPSSRPGTPRHSGRRKSEDEATRMRGQGPTHVARTSANAGLTAQAKRDPMSCCFFVPSSMVGTMKDNRWDRT